MGDRKTEIYFTFSLLITVLTFTSIDTAPVQRRSINMQDAHIYLQKYGYMTTKNPSAEELEESMMTMQRYFGLSETGRLDEDTMDMMSQPRCGIADIHPSMVLANCTRGISCRRRRYTLLGYPWDSTSLSYRFNNLTPDLGRSQVESAIERALGVWAEVTPLQFTRKPDGISFAAASDIEVVFGRGNHGINNRNDESFDGPSATGGSVLAHAFNPGSVYVADIRGDMHFDEDELWQDGRGIDLFTVAAHEFGHSLGLGHSDVRGALMFPTYYGFDPNFRLHVDDIAGIQNLYGPRPVTTTVQPRPRTTTSRKDTTARKDTTSRQATTSPTSTMMTYGVDYCDPSDIDNIATISSVFDGIYKVAIKDQTFVRFATEDTILLNAFQNVEQSALDIIWRDSPDPILALFEKDDGSLVVIRANDYWEYDTSSPGSIQLKLTYPRSLTSLRIPANIEIKAALTSTTGVYLFSEFDFWYYGRNLRTFDYNSPFAINTTWPGVPTDFNAAFRWQDSSCFVKGSLYYCFNETTAQVDSPRLFAEDWLGCDGIQQSTAAPCFRSHSGYVLIAFCWIAIVLLQKY